jgi:hypothetical protein
MIIAQSASLDDARLIAGADTGDPEHQVRQSRFGPLRMQVLVAVVIGVGVWFPNTGAALKLRVRGIVVREGRGGAHREFTYKLLQPRRAAEALGEKGKGLAPVRPQPRSASPGGRRDEDAPA